MREPFNARSPGNSRSSGSENQQTQDPDHKFRDLIQASPVAIYTCDAQGYITFYNQAAAKLWGRKPDLGQDLWCGSWKIYYPDGRPMALDNCPMARTLKEGKAFEGAEIVIERPDHTFRHLLVFPRPEFSEENIITGAHNTLVDITEQKQDEEKKAILSAIVTSSDDAIISKTLEGIITSWNAGAERIFGYSEDEIVGKHITTLIPPALQNEENTIISQIRSGNKIDHFQTTRLHKSGREINISLTVSPLKDKHGTIIGASKVARDITGQLDAQRKIEEHSARLTLLNNVSKAISEKLDIQAILQQVTDATTQLTGAAFGAFFYNEVNENGESYMLYTLSGASRDAFDKFGMPRNTRVFEPTFSGKATIRVANIHQDPRYGHNPPHHGMPEGHLPVVSYLAVPVISTSGGVIGGLFFGHPEAGVFTEEHETIVENIASSAAIAIDHSRLFENVKALSAKKDEFIALASHELKTPLTTIKGYLQVLQRMDMELKAKQFLEKIVRQTDKLHELIADLLDASRVEAGKLQISKTSFDLGTLVRDIVDTENHINKTHRIILKESRTDFTVVADRQRIEQVIINLLTNAVKYSPHSDQVIMELTGSATEVTLKVRDFGIGLTAKQQSQVFTRFYRADGTDHIAGLGLGLYLSKEIIDRHEGTIGVTSEIGAGSAFFFTLPKS